MKNRYEIIKEETDENTNFWIARDNKKDKYFVDCFMKTEEGIKHISLSSSKIPRKFDLMRSLNHQRSILHRPFALSQENDGYSEPAVLALYEDFCKTKDLDPKGIYKQSYPLTGRSGTYESSVTLGKWQGVQYPQSWDFENYEKLQSLLLKSNYDDLMTTLHDKVSDQNIFNNIEIDLILREIDNIDLSTHQNQEENLSNIDEDEDFNYQV